jgi:alpha-tubulin suppressor-like RCC1 family protein
LHQAKTKNRDGAVASTTEKDRVMVNARRLAGYVGVLLVVAIAPGAAMAAGPGSLVGWGSNRFGQCDVPEPNADFVAMEPGFGHMLGLKSDGSIVAWGLNDNGQCDVPAPNTGFVAVSGGAVHSLGLKADGSVVAWGWNDYGQCDVPEPNAGFVAVAAGEDQNLGLKADGSIVAWGNNDFGQCNVPEPNSGFVAVAAGALHSLGLKADGSIVGWGNNQHGQSSAPQPNTGFVAISAGYWHSMALTANGSIVAWGENRSNQCDVPEPNTGFVAVAAGFFEHSMGLKADGSIRAWGYDWNNTGHAIVPAPNSGFVAIAAGGEFSYGLTVIGPNRAPVLTNPGDRISSQGLAVSLQLEASDREGDTLTYGAAGLPEGLTCDPATGLVGGTVAVGAAGVNEVTVSVSDGQYEDSKTFIWTVSAFGDVDHSGDAPDAVDLQLVINGALHLEPYDTALDLDHNGRIDAIDVQLEIIAILGL